MRIQFLYIAIFCSLSIFSIAASETFVLLLGPSGSGKSTMIHLLQEKDSRFVYIKPYTTRPLRPGEVDKIHISREEMEEMERRGELLAINYIYGIYYATPKTTIDQALVEGNYPILDWPVFEIEKMHAVYGDVLLNVYVFPESIEELHRRLALDGRDVDGKRALEGARELQCYYAGEFDQWIDLHIQNDRGQEQLSVDRIYKALMERIQNE